MDDEEKSQLDTSAPQRTASGMVQAFSGAVRAIDGTTPSGEGVPVDDSRYRDETELVDLELAIELAEQITDPHSLRTAQPPAATEAQIQAGHAVTIAAVSEPTQVDASFSRPLAQSQSQAQPPSSMAPADQTMITPPTVDGTTPPLAPTSSLDDDALHIDIPEFDNAPSYDPHDDPFSVEHTDGFRPSWLAGSTQEIQRNAFTSTPSLVLSREDFSATFDSAQQATRSQRMAEKLKTVHPTALVFGTLFSFLAVCALFTAIVAAIIPPREGHRSRPPTSSAKR